MNERRDSEFTYRLDMEKRDSGDDSLLAFCPIEVFERKYLRNLQQQKEQEDSGNKPSTSAMYRLRDEKTTVSNSLQIPILSIPNVMEKPPPTENVYSSENMTIIDTDLPVSFQRLQISLTVSRNKLSFSPRNDRLQMRLLVKRAMLYQQ